METCPEEVPLVMKLLNEWLEYVNGDLSQGVITKSVRGVSQQLSLEPLIVDDWMNITPANIKFIMFKFLRANSNVNKRLKKSFSYAGEYESIVRGSLMVEIHGARELVTLRDLWKEIIDSNLLIMKRRSIGSIFSSYKTLKTEFIEAWRKKSFELFQTEEARLTKVELVRKCRLLLGHEAFSKDYEHGRNGVPPLYRERLEERLEDAKDVLKRLTEVPDQKAVVSTMVRR